MNVDVLVIGAGPSGCAAAAMLARCGRRTVLIDRPSRGRHTLAESIPPSAHRLLVELGMKNAVDAAGFHSWLGNTVWWGSAEPRIEPFARGEAGYQVERARFDAVLREQAAKTGAELIAGVVRDVDMNETPVRLTMSANGEIRELRATIALDCSGRSGVIARKGLRQHEASHRTIALAGVWRASAPWPSSQDGHTLVASHPDGWAWSVPTSRDTRYVTVMVDPARSRLDRDVQAIDVYRAELRKVAPFTPLVEHATLVDGPFGAHASLYDSARYSGPGFLLVGDAASFIDPLSSFGVKKALASGWLAAITANTILETPSMQDAALAFFERRERAVVESFRRQTARYAADTGEASAHPFWEARVGDFGGRVFRPGESAEDPPSEDPTALARDPDVLAAFDDLRRRPEIHLTRSDQVRTGPRAAIRGSSIVMDDHVVLPAWPSGVRYIRNIDLLLLLQLAPEHRDVGELYDAMFRAQPGVSLPDFLGALSTLIARGALKHGQA